MSIATKRHKTHKGSAYHLPRCAFCAFCGSSFSLVSLGVETRRLTMIFLSEDQTRAFGVDSTTLSVSSLARDADSPDSGECFPFRPIDCLADQYPRRVACYQRPDLLFGRAPASDDRLAGSSLCSVSSRLP